MFSYPFMQHAYIIGTLIAIVSSTVGVFIVARSMNFLAHTLSEIGFAGAAFGLFMGWNPLIGMLIFTILASTSVGQLGIKEGHSESLISLVSAVSIGLGIAFLSISQKNASAATGILFGSIFSISRINIIEVIVLVILIIIFMVMLFRPLKHFAFDYSTAIFSLKNLTVIEISFLIIMAATVAVSVQVVGTLLIFILMTIPASAAKHWGKTVWQMIGLSITFSVTGVWLALAFSYWTNVPASFYIAIIEAGIYLIGILKTKRRY